jgi:hypothetical protein
VENARKLMVVSQSGEYANSAYIGKNAVEVSFLPAMVICENKGKHRCDVESKISGLLTNMTKLNIFDIGLCAESADWMSVGICDLVYDNGQLIVTLKLVQRS